MSYQPTYTYQPQYVTPQPQQHHQHQQPQPPQQPNQKPQPPQQPPQPKQEQKQEQKKEEKEPNYIELAWQLRKAMKGWGTNDKVLIEIIGSHTYLQLQKLAESYKLNVKRDLLQDIHDETSGNYKNTLIALLTDKTEYDSQLLNQAIKGFGTNDELLIELVCTRTPDELKAMCNAYQKNYNKKAEKDIEDDVSGDYGKLLLTILNAPRNQMPDKAQMDRDVRALYDAGEGKIGTDEGVFIRILGTNPRAYVEELSNAYCKAYGKSLAVAIRDETSFNFKKALLTLVTPVDEFFADQLYEAMKGLGTHDGKLIRIIVSQKNRNRLAGVGGLFLHKYQSTLKTWTNDDTSGDYRKILQKVLDTFCPTSIVSHHTV